MEENIFIIEDKFELKDYEVFKHQLLKVSENVYHNYLYEYKYIYDDDNKLIRIIRRKIR